MFDANRISTAETHTEQAANSSNDTVSNYLYTILLSMLGTIQGRLWMVKSLLLSIYFLVYICMHTFQDTQIKQLPGTT